MEQKQEKFSTIGYIAAALVCVLELVMCGAFLESVRRMEAELLFWPGQLQC